MSSRKKAPRPAGPSVVVDLGSHSLKAGFGNVALGSGWAPDLVEPTATLPEEGRATQLGANAVAAFDRRSAVVRPVRRGKVVDHAQLELLLNHLVANTLEANAGRHSILFADAPGHGAGSNKDREFFMTLAFEKWNMRACVFYPAPVLAAFSAGKTTATVVDCGHESSSVSVVYEGRMEQNKVLRVDHPSASDKMLQLLMGNERGTLDDLGPAVEKIALDNCYVCANIARERAKAKAGRTKKKYKLPDGQWITISEERFAVPEDLMTAPFGNRWRKAGQGGLPGAVASVLQGTFEEHGQTVYRDLAENLVACGGRSDVEGFDERFDTELRVMLGVKKKKKYVEGDEDDPYVSELDASRAAEEQKENTSKMTEPFDFVPKSRSRKHPRRFATWAGGALISDFRGLREMWTTKKQFEELGADLAVDGRRF